MKNNYQEEMFKIINNLKKGKSKLLLHSCCAPCSSYVIDYLKDYFEITVLFYNPNIYPEAEYLKRKVEQIKLLDILKIKYLDSNYDNELFAELIKNNEEDIEGGIRCSTCINFRLEETAITAKRKNFDYFGTTLSVSPHKNSKTINEAGEHYSLVVKVPYLVADFKKSDGYKKSVELSKKYNLYRQDYCGCKYSKKGVKDENKCT